MDLGYVIDLRFASDGNSHTTDIGLTIDHAYAVNGWGMSETSTPRILKTHDFVVDTEGTSDLLAIDVFLGTVKEFFFNSIGASLSDEMALKVSRNILSNMIGFSRDADTQVEVTRPIVFSGKGVSSTSDVFVIMDVLGIITASFLTELDSILTVDELASALSAVEILSTTNVNE